MSYRFIILSISLTLLLSTTLSAAEFVEKTSFQVPGLTGVDEIHFNDITFDGKPEALARQGNRFALFTLGATEPIFSDTVARTTIEDEVRILFKDINRDNIPDIAIGVFNYYLPPGGFTISFLDGLDIIRGVYTIQHPVSDTFSTYISPMGIGLFDAYDLDNDGYNEFMYSCDSSNGNDGVGMYMYGIRGATKKYYSFPDSLEFCNDIFYDNPHYFDYTYGRSLFVNGTVGYWHEIGMGVWYISNTKFVEVVDDQLFTKSSRDKYHYAYYTYEVPLTTGDLTSASLNNELLCRYQYDYYYDEVLQIHESAYRMYAFLPPDSLELIWELPSNQYYPNIQYCPENRYAYYSFGDIEIIKFSGIDGSEIERFPFPPPGPGGNWDTFNDPYKKDYFVKAGNTITIYSFDIATGVDDDGEQHPTIFTLGRPYPNPFNATQTIPVTVDRPGTELLVTVYNLLGQEVETIYRGAPNSQHLEIQWNAGMHASGVYFIKAISGQTTRVVRTVLLK